MSMGRATCPLLMAAALGAAQPCGVSLTTRGIAPASLRYDRLTLVAWIAGPLCLAGDPLMDCVPAHLSTVAFMAPGDVCHGTRCSLAGPGPAAFGYRPCCWPVGSAGLPQCTRPMGCWFFPVPRPPYVSTFVRCPGPLGSCSPMCPLDALFCLCGVLGHFAPVHQCARSVRGLACAVSWATGLLITDAPARCTALRVRCPGPLNSCSTVRPLGVLFCLCSVLGHLALVHRCARSVCCFACLVSWATCLLFTGVPPRCVACVCGALGHLAPAHRCARSACCVVCAVSLATWLLFTGLPAWCVVSLLRCPGPLGSCSPVCPLCVLCCVCGVLGKLAPVHGCARSVCCVVCAVSWATWILFTNLPSRCVALCVLCPGPLRSCYPSCPLGALLCVCGILGHLAPVHRCARSVRCLCVRCPWPLGFCSSVCLLGVLLCVCGVLGNLAPVHWCARAVRCFACAVSWATWLLFTAVPSRCVVLLVQCSGPLGSCSPLCPRGALPVCAVSWAVCLFFFFFF